MKVTLVLCTFLYAGALALDKKEQKALNKQIDHLLHSGAFLKPLIPHIFPNRSVENFGIHLRLYNGNEVDVSYRRDGDVKKGRRTLVRFVTAVKSFDYEYDYRLVIHGGTPLYGTVSGEIEGLEYSITYDTKKDNRKHSKFEIKEPGEITVNLSPTDEIPKKYKKTVGYAVEAGVRTGVIRNHGTL